MAQFHNTIKSKFRNFVIVIIVGTEGLINSIVCRIAERHPVLCDIMMKVEHYTMNVCLISVYLMSYSITLFSLYT